MQLFTVGGEILPTVGETEIKLNGFPPIEVIIVRNIKHDMILGDDVLRRGNCLLNYNARKMKLFDTYYTLIDNDSASVYEVTKTSGYKCIDEVVEEYSEVFSSKGQPIGNCNVGECTIDTGDHPPIKQRAYRMPFSKRHLVEVQIQEMLDAGVIQPSSSPWASPITLVPKKDGSTRFCIDFRSVNSILRKDSYPIGSIQDIFDQLSGATIFTTLDLLSGYWQIPVAEKDREKTAFTCHTGLYEFLKMPFGLSHAGSVFQRTMNKVLAGLINKCVFVYIDDLVIYSSNPAEHAKHLRLVLERLKNAGLRIKTSKCTIAAPEVELLGYTVSEKGIRAQSSKISAIKQLDVPTTVREIRSFLGMTGYYRNCIPQYAKIAEPLVKLTRKYQRFQWSEEQQKAFETLKDILCSNQIMAYPNLQKPYKLFTDACDYAIGGILCQEDENGVERVVQYVSHQLSGNQLKWATIEKEAYAVIYCITKLRPYLWGAEFTVFTDHKPLKSLFTAQMKNTKIQRWAVLIAEYGCQIKYHEGVKNIRADMLSRIKPSLSEIATFDTEEYIDPNAFPEEDADMRLPLEADNLNEDEVKENQIKEFPHLFRQAADKEDSDYVVLKGLLYSRKSVSPFAAQYPRLILPSKYQQAVIIRCHIASGHQAVNKTLERVRDGYVWPKMRETIWYYIRKCPTCRVHMNKAVHTKFSEMPLPATPMQIIGMDLIGPFAESPNGNRYILTIIDHCSGWAECFPIPSKAATHVHNKLVTEFFPRHGIPEIIITDQGGEFNANEFREMLREIGVTHKRTTPYFPQTNGKTETFNRTLKEMLERLVNNNYRAWEEQVPAALTAYRNATSVVTGYTPFFLLYGRRGRLPLVRSFTAATGPAHNARLYDLARALTCAREMTAHSRKHNRERINARATEGEVKVGDTVVVKANERVTLTSRWDPQYEVYDVWGPVVKVRNQQTGRIRVVNKSKVVVVDPDMIWDDVNVRPRRQHKQKLVVTQTHPDDVEGDDNVATEKCDVGDTPENDNLSNSNQQLIEHEEFAKATSDLPPSACTRAQKRYLSSTPHLEEKRARIDISKRKCYAPDEIEQKRQKLEAVELATLFYCY